MTKSINSIFKADKDSSFIKVKLSTGHRKATNIGIDEIILVHFKCCIFGLKTPAFIEFLFQFIKVCGNKEAETGRDEENYQKKYTVYCMCRHTPVHGSLARAHGLLRTKHKYIFYNERECFSRNFSLKKCFNHERKYL